MKQLTVILTESDDWPEAKTAGSTHVLSHSCRILPR